jgi:hypothetical protein
MAMMGCDLQANVSFGHGGLAVFNGSKVSSGAGRARCRRTNNLQI